MEVKKSPKADLEGKKTIFLEIGFVIALGILLSAFNWKTNTKVEEGFVITQEEQVEEEIIPITQQMMKPPPPPPPAPKLTDLIEIVEDELSIRRRNLKSTTRKLMLKTKAITTLITTETAGVKKKRATEKLISSK